VNKDDDLLIFKWNDEFFFFIHSKRMNRNVKQLCSSSDRVNWFVIRHFVTSKATYLKLIFINTNFFAISFNLILFNRQSFYLNSFSNKRKIKIIFLIIWNV